jgi:hypothetical protein
MNRRRSNQHGVAARLQEKDVERVSHSTAEFRVDRTASSLTTTDNVSRAERRACLDEGR